MQVKAERDYLYLLENSKFSPAFNKKKEADIYVKTAHEMR